MKGSYVLILYLREGKKIGVGKLGEIYFEGGYYAYVGSALGGIKRHLREEKRMKWHIDYLAREAKILEVWYKEGEEREECIIAGRLREKFKFIKNFGSSDCKCESHLFYSSSIDKFQKILKAYGMKRMG